MQVAVIWGEQPIAEIIRSPDLFRTFQRIEASSVQHVKATRTSASDEPKDVIDPWIEKLRKDQPIHWIPQNQKQGDCKGVGLRIKTTENLSISVSGVFLKPKTYVCDIDDKGCLEYMKLAIESISKYRGDGVTYDNGGMYKASELESMYAISELQNSFPDGGMKMYEILPSQAQINDKGRNSIYGFMVDVHGSRQELGASTLGLGIHLSTIAKGLYLASLDGTDADREKETKELEEQRPAASMSQIVAISDSRFVATEWAQDRSRNRVKKNLWFAETSNFVQDTFIWEDAAFDRIKSIRDMIGSILIGFAFALLCEMLIASVRELSKYSSSDE